MQTDIVTPYSPPVLVRMVGPTVFLVLGVGVEWLLLQHRQEQAMALREKSTLQSEKIRARIEGELHAATSFSNSFAGYWSMHRSFPSPSETSQILGELYRHDRYVRNFALTEGYQVAQVFPPNGNGLALGTDLRSQPNLWPTLQRGIESHAPVLTGPSSASLQLDYWVPVFTDGQFQGLLSTLIDGPSLFSAVGLAQEEYRYALRTQGESALKNHTVLGEDGLFDDAEAATTDISIPGGTWRLAIKATAPTPTWPAIARVLGWLISGLFAAQLALLLKLNSQLSDLSLYDRLTGLPSRHLFLDRLKQTLRRIKRNRGYFSVLFIDLNEFRSINDSQGEKVGDMMLAGIGKRLLNAIRHCDTVTRWGGDEFLVLLDACSLEQAGAVAESLRHKIELPVSYGGLELRIGAAIGAAAYPEDGHSLNALLKIANSRMLKDKNRAQQSKPYSTAPAKIPPLEQRPDSEPPA